MRNDLGIAGLSATVKASSGVSRRRVVVWDNTNSTNTNFYIKNPAAANAGALAGITRQAGADGKQVAVGDSGFEEIEAASAISIGDLVNVADSAGRVKVIDEAAGTANVVGEARQAASALGDIIMVDLERFGEVV